MFKLYRTLFVEDSFLISTFDFTFKFYFILFFFTCYKHEQRKLQPFLFICNFDGKQFLAACFQSNEMWIFYCQIIFAENSVLLFNFVKAEAIERRRRSSRPKQICVHVWKMILRVALHDEFNDDNHHHSMIFCIMRLKLMLLE